jgi:ATP-dependent exoDNAse (exonuclease V) alpha subunit
MITLSDDQREVVDQIDEWWRNGDEDDLELRIGGLAGTGKTTIAGLLPERLGLQREAVAYCAFTGKAASALNERLVSPGATTIHRLIYHPREVHCASCPAGSLGSARCHGPCKDCYIHWERRDELDPGLELIIVDESSMVDEWIYGDLRSYGVPIVWIGDHGQLPPVRGNFNLMEDPDLRLEKVHRHVAGSPILNLAMMARREGRVPFGEFGPGVRKRTANGGLDLDLDQLPLLLCWMNRTRIGLNRHVRDALGHPPERPVVGDHLICLRNNYGMGILNGMPGVLQGVEAGKGSYDVEILLESGDTYRGPIASDQFNREGRPQVVSRDVDLFDYGYALTVHKAQGSEAEHVVLLEEHRESAPDHARWLYTGITRAKISLEIVA